MQILMRESNSIVRRSAPEPTATVKAGAGYGSRQEANQVSTLNIPPSTNSSRPAEQANAVRTMAIGRPSGRGIDWAEANHIVVIPEDNPLLDSDSSPVEPPIDEVTVLVPVDEDQSSFS